MAKVSIIIPVYNRRTLVQKAVESALNQTYNDYEIIISDNFSTDGTYEYLLDKYSSNKKIAIFRTEQNLGPVRNWINCLQYTSGEYIKILWSDDLISKNFLEKTVGYLEKHHDCAFILSNIFYIDENDNIVGKPFVFSTSKRISRRKFFKKKILNQQYKKRDLPVSPGCAIFRRNDFKIDANIENKFGIDFYRTGAGIDERIFLNSFYTKKYKYCYIDSDITSFFRYHAGSISLLNSTIYREYNVSRIEWVKAHDPFKKYLFQSYYKALCAEREFIGCDLSLNILEKYEIKKSRLLCCAVNVRYKIKKLVKKLLRRKK